MSKLSKEYDLSYTQNREISWLRFNERVLDEASDKTVPLIERLRFISIFTSNLTEFFMVRVGSLLDLAVVTPNNVDNKSGETPKEQLESIFNEVPALISKRDKIFKDVMKQLSQKGILDIPFDELNGVNKSYVNEYYNNRIKPLLSPQIIDHNHPFPHLKNDVLYVAALLKNEDKEMLGIVGIPEDVPSIIMLPGENGQFVRTETIIASKLKKIFHIYEFDEYSVINVTRNADINYAKDSFDEDNPDFRIHMSKLIKMRDNLAPVRLEMQNKTFKLKKMLLNRLNLTEKQCYVCDCPLILKYAFKLEDCDKSLYNDKYTPKYPDYVNNSISMWEQVSKKDILLFYPYHSMKPFLDLLREAAYDKDVVSIKMTIYRLASDSMIIKNLCDAVENGKDVTVLVELRARFDEKNNIGWAKVLEDAGCKVIYGPDDFKCHSKICLITKKCKNELCYITQIGTGNYNEKTSSIYTDFSLLTADKSIAQDAIAFFQNMLIGNLYGEYKELLVAPVSMKNTILNLIDKEILKRNNGKIIIKANSITERTLIDKLVQASKAGVKIDLIIRGICCILPGIPDKTSNITVTSIVGRFLEHSRVYYFGEGQDSKVYISSADIMTRNQTQRVEIACPVNDIEIKNWLIDYLKILLMDNSKARRMLPSGKYIGVYVKGSPVIDSQKYFMEHHIEFEKAYVNKKSIFDKIRNFFRGNK